MKMKRTTSLFLAAIMTLSVVFASAPMAFAGESLPMTGEAARKQNQPKFSGYRILDIKDWSPETDPYAQFLVSRIPLQKRNEAFKPTQANPQLDSDAQIMLMQGDYGNTFVDGMMYNNTFGQNTLNFWQYTDYFSPWHGATTSSTPEALYDWTLELTDSNAWQKRYFEFGVLNIPNPAYTNAAHRNGVKSIACIYFDQSFRAGQTINELFVTDADGKFPVAEKLIDMAKYFGYDGYFFNCEEAPDDRMVQKKFLARLESAGLWTQFYDTNSSMNSSKADWLDYDLNGDGVKERLQDSVFVNYSSFTGLNSQFDFIKNAGINPFERVFYGVEANQGKFSGSHGSVSNLSNLYAEGTKNPRASIALFTPSDYYQRGLDGDLNKKADVIQDPDYQWMIAERERMYFSGVKSDPTNTGKQAGYSRPDVGVNKADGWVGVADFTSERSVISGSVFHTNFNVGKGMQYFSNGSVSHDSQWTNITVQDILPSWQWWMDVPQVEDTTSATAGAMKDAGAKLKADFDYGQKYYTGATNFTHVGAYNGGSSLVVAGNLEVRNTLHLYKTDLAVKSGSTAEITFNKPSGTDATEMSLVIYLKDDPTNPVYLPIADTGRATDGWVTRSVDLGKYAGKQIAAFGLGFDAKQASAPNYQMNIGEIRIRDGANHMPNAPTGFRLDKIYATDEYVAKWDLANFDTVDRYDLYATLSNGTKLHVGSNYDSIYYMKSLMNEKEVARLELVAVGKDGCQSTPAVINLDFKDKVSDLTAKTAMNSTNIIRQNATMGLIELSWKQPAVDYQAIEFTAHLVNSTDTYSVTKTVAKGTESVAIPFDRADGESYEVSARTVFADGTKSEAITISGRTKDTYAKPYEADKVKIDGSSATFWQPGTQDWWKLHVKSNGNTVSFGSRFAGTKPYSLRGTTYMRGNLGASTGTLEIVVEDYSGNFSEPTYVNFYADPEKEVDESMIPDPVLLAAVKEQAGTTIQEINEFKGTLNLADLDIHDFTGLNLLGNATGLDLTATTVTQLSKDFPFPARIEKLVLKDAAKLDLIDFGTFQKLSALKELDLTGCSSLRVANLNNSTLEKMVYGSAEAFPALISLNMSDSKFDMTPGTPERIFADQIQKQNEGKADIEIKSPEKTNLAPNAVILAESTMSNAAKLFDGKMNYFTISLPSEAVIKFNSPQEIVGFKLTNDGSSYGLADFELQYSTDGKEWETWGTAVTGNKQVTYTQDLDTPPTASYYKFIATKGYGWGNDIKELELYGHQMIVYKAGAVFGGQKPEVYYNYPETATLPLGNEAVDPMTLIQAQTIRGTGIADVQKADFIAQDYDVAAQMVPQGIRAKIYDSQKNVFTAIATDHSANYQVEFIRFNAQNPGGKVEGTMAVTVGEGDPQPTVPTEALTLNLVYAAMQPGETLKITATVSPSGTTDSLTWETSDASIATVKDGVVTAIAPGKAVITAKSGDKEATCEIEVKAKTESDSSNPSSGTTGGSQGTEGNSSSSTESSGSQGSTSNPPTGGSSLYIVLAAFLLASAAAALLTLKKKARS